MKRVISAMFLCCVLSSNLIVANKPIQFVSIGRIKQVLDMFKRCPGSVVKDNRLHQQPDVQLISNMNIMFRELRNLDNGRCANYPNNTLSSLIDLEDKKLEEIYLKSIKGNVSEKKK